MGAPCSWCGEIAAVGVLCTDCAARLPACEGLIPEHISSRVERRAASAWLIDGFGFAHPVAAERTLVGRRASADVAILNASVSREHAELRRCEARWELRDLGSRNATHVDGERVQGRAPVPGRATLRFGDVPLLFVGDPIALPERLPASVATGHAVGSGAVRFTLRSPEVELCLLAPRADEDTGGALLHRRATGAAWAEVSLPPLEFQLLRALCVRAAADGGSLARTRGCVATRQLARALPFHSRYANEENVRQVVRRVRATLDAVGVVDLVEASPGRGYFLGWPVVVT